MNISKLIQDLLDAGYSEARIAEEVSCPTSQATINRIKTGERKSVRFELGMAIIELHQRVTAEPQPQERASA